jgi:hypothetical protein
MAIKNMGHGKEGSRSISEKIFGVAHFFIVFSTYSPHTLGQRSPASEPLRTRA